jgi:iron complex transport system substrate-binding protein
MKLIGQSVKWMTLKKRIQSVRGTVIPLLLCQLCLFIFSACMADAREIVDMTGRQVTVPDMIRKVYGTSPPATYMVYALGTEMMAGLNSPLTPSETRYIDPRLQSLPVIGGWFGQGRVSNMETLLEVRPDMILTWVFQQSTINEKIEAALKPFGIPVVYIRLESLADYPAAFRFLGNLFDRRERAEALCRYAEQSLEEVARVAAALPDSDRVSVYYAEGADGLSTECHSSIHAQLIPLSGGENVHRCSDSSTVGMQKVSMEQILQYNPQVIVAHEPLFFNRIRTDSKWKTLRAVQDGRVYRIPSSPFNWFDRPPSFMRLLGVKWLTHQLYPNAYPIDMVTETRNFYQLFLKVSLDEAAARELLKNERIDN